MKFFKKFYPFLFILFVVLFFFNPIFKGYIPFPGDLLINTNPYSSESFLGYLPGSYPNKAQGADVITEIYPWKYFSINELKNGNIPFWNPYNFSGNVQMANFQTALFYPLNIIFFVFPFNVSFAIFILLQPLLAAIFMFLFLKKGIGLKKLASVLGGIAFAFSSYMVVWIEYGNISSTIAYLPLALLLIKKIVEKISLKNFLLLVIVFTLSFLAGYIQGFFYIYTVCILYFLFLLFIGKEKKKLKKSLLFLSALIFPIILSLFQLLPTLEIFNNSTRGSYSLSQFSKSLAPIYYWITIVFPDFFGNPASRNYYLDGTYIERVMYPGVVILFFAIFAIFKVKNVSKKFFTILAAVSLIIATNIPLIKYFYLLPIPVISTTIPTREFSIFIFSLIVLGAMGINFWIENKNKTKYPIFFLILLILIFPIVFLIYKLGFLTDINFKVSLRNMVLPTALVFATVVIFYLKNKLKRVSLVLITIIIIFDSFYFFNKITPFSPSSFTYPKTNVINFLKENAGINRFWGYGSGYIQPNFQSVDKAFSPEGNDPLHISSYGELLASSKYGELPEILPRPDANIAPGYGDTDLKTNNYRQRLLNLLGVKYVLHKNDLLTEKIEPDYVTFTQESYKLIWQKKHWQVYENKQVFDRFYLTSDFEIVKEKEKRIAKIYDENIDLRKTLILEEELDIETGKITNSDIKLLSYRPNRVEFKIKADANTLFFISDNFFPGWRAFVDEKEVKIYRANYSFRAVPILKGEHILIMTYYPYSFDFGIKASFVALLLFLIYLLFFKKIYEK